MGGQRSHFKPCAKRLTCMPDLIGKGWGRGGDLPSKFLPGVGLLDPQSVKSPPSPHLAPIGGGWGLTMIGAF